MTCSVPKYSQGLPCRGLKVLFVPTLAKAHPDPKLSRVRVPSDSRHPEGAEQSPRSAQGWVLLFAPLEEKSMPVLAPLGWRVLALAPALRCPGPGKARGEQGARGRQQHQGSTSVPALLVPASLCFFDKNLEEERDGIRAVSRAGLGRC